MRVSRQAGHPSASYGLPPCNAPAQLGRSWVNLLAYLLAHDFAHPNVVNEFILWQLCGRWSVALGGRRLHRGGAQLGVWVAPPGPASREQQGRRFSCQCPALCQPGCMPASMLQSALHATSSPWPSAHRIRWLASYQSRRLARTCKDSSRSAVCGHTVPTGGTGATRATLYCSGQMLTPPLQRSHYNCTTFHTNAFTHTRLPRRMGLADCHTVTTNLLQVGGAEVLNVRERSLLRLGRLGRFGWLCGSCGALSGPLWCHAGTATGSPQVELTAQVAGRRSRACNSAQSSYHARQNWRKALQALEREPHLCMGARALKGRSIAAFGTHLRACLLPVSSQPRYTARRGPSPYLPTLARRPRAPWALLDTTSRQHRPGGAR